eukprot:scaffold1_cov402-Prasinococcus_capsulatus_cf.AAC.41
MDLDSRCIAMIHDDDARADDCGRAVRTRALRSTALYHLTRLTSRRSRSWMVVALVGFLSERCPRRSACRIAAWLAVHSEPARAILSGTSLGLVARCSWTLARTAKQRAPADRTVALPAVVGTMLWAWLRTVRRTKPGRMPGKEAN